MPQIEVTFDIDANGILQVSAKDQKTGKEAKIRIESSSGLSKDEVEKMRRDAESHADEDKKKRELADVRNEADQTIWQIEKLLKDNAGKISEGDKAPVQRGHRKGQASGQRHGRQRHSASAQQPAIRRPRDGAAPATRRADPSPNGQEGAPQARKRRMTSSTRSLK